MTPAFARLEIALSDKADIMRAVAEMRLLATELQHICARVSDNHLMRLAAHDAIRATSGKTRNPATPSN